MFFVTQCNKGLEKVTSPNEFGSMTARKGDIKPLHVEQNISEKNINTISSPLDNASFGTFCIQIG